MALYTKKAFIERIKRHINNGWPASSFSISDNEVLLHIDTAVARQLVGQAYENAKIEGVLAVPEAYYVTYALSTPTLNALTKEYSTTLPQPPVSLPLGYSISDIYFGGTSGRSQPVTMVKAKRASYRQFLPMPNGILAKVEGSTLKLWTSNGQPLNPAVNTLYVTMATSRTGDVNDMMNVPDDVVTVVFDYVVKELLQRMGIVKDTIDDSLTAGNKGG